MNAVAVLITAPVRERILAEALHHQGPDDREPGEVIKEVFHGDEGAYLTDRARAFGIPLTEDAVLDPTSIVN